MLDSPLHVSLVAWINKLKSHGLHKEKDIKKFIELKDGIILSELFNSSVPEQNRIAEGALYKDHEDNWAFTLKNLNLIFDSVQAYTHQTLGEIEFLSIFNEENVIALQKLVEEVFSVILSCDRKNDFITAIMELDEEDQERLSHFLQKLLKGDQQGHEELQMSPNRSIPRNASALFDQRHQSRTSSAVASNEKELLKKIDDLEFAEMKERKNHEELRKEFIELQQKLESIVEESSKKDRVIDKLIKQRDDFFTIFRSNSYEEVVQELKTKTSRISELNKVIDELKQQHSENINILQVKILFDAVIIIIY